MLPNVPTHSNPGDPLIRTRRPSRISGWSSITATEIVSAVSMIQPMARKGYLDTQKMGPTCLGSNRFVNEGNFQSDHGSGPGLGVNRQASTQFFRPPLHIGQSVTAGTPGAIKSLAIVTNRAAQRSGDQLHLHLHEAAMSVFDNVVERFLEDQQHFTPQIGSHLVRLLTVIFYELQLYAALGEQIAGMAANTLDQIGGESVGTNGPDNVTHGLDQLPAILSAIRFREAASCSSRPCNLRRATSLNRAICERPEPTSSCRSEQYAFESAPLQQPVHAIGVQPPNDQRGDGGA